jgi:hypothetical protein
MEKSKVTSSSMDLLKTLSMLEALKLELQKYGKNEDLQAQVVDSVLYLFLSIGMPYYQEGCNISSKTKDEKYSLVDLDEN